MSSNKIVLLTGSNRSLGLALARLIAGRSEPITLLATSRGGVELADLELGNPASQLVFPKLDITSKDSIQTILELIKSRYGHLDALINNAGAEFEENDNSTFGPEIVKRTFDVNYSGSANLTEALFPIFSKGAHIVYLSSMASFQVPFNENPDLKNRITTAKDRATLDAFIDEYANASKDKTAEGDGWLRTGFLPAYTVSKAFLNLLTVIQARDHPELVINAACPGITETDMSQVATKMGFKAKKVDEGARIPLRLAFDDLKGVSGKFWTGNSTADTGYGNAVDNWIGKEIVWDKME